VALILVFVTLFGFWFCFSLGLTYTVLEGNLSIFKNNGADSGILSQTLGLENFATAC